MSGRHCAIGGDGQLFQGPIKLERRVGGPGPGSTILQDARPPGFLPSEPRISRCCGRKADSFSLVTLSSSPWHRDSGTSFQKVTEALMTALPRASSGRGRDGGGGLWRRMCGVQGGRPGPRALRGPTARQQKPTNQPTSQPTNSPAGPGGSSAGPGIWVQ